MLGNMQLNGLMLMIYYRKENDMTRKEAGQFWPIIKAYSEGKDIEVKDPYDGKWKYAENPGFTLIVDSYRVKKEPVYKPFGNANECLEEMANHEPFGWITNDAGDNFMVIHTTEIGYTLCNNMFHTYLEALNIGQKFIDGTPFGVKEDD